MTDSRMKLILIPDADGAASSFKRDHSVHVYSLIKIECVGVSDGVMCCRDLVKTNLKHLPH